MMKEIVAVDPGYGNTKVVTLKHRLTFPSRVGPASEPTYKLSNRQDLPGETVTIAGRSYFVGQKTELCDNVWFSLTRDWVKSPIYAALITSALIRATPSLQPSAEVFVITGLPVHYMPDKEIAKQQIMSAANSLHIDVTGVKVIPQPFGSFYDYLLDDSGKPSKAGKIRLIGVIDVGHNTSDYILVRDLKNYIEQKAGTISLGMTDVIDGVRRDIMQRFELDNITGAQVEECIRGKSIRIRGEIKNISEEIKKHAHDIAQSILGEIRSRWSREDEIDLVLLSGGGSLLLKNYLQNITHNVQLLDKPQLANARGYFKLASLLQMRAGLND